MAEKIFQAVGLDLGSQHTRIVACILENSRIRFCGYGEYPSQGWVKGGIADQQAVAESIMGALAEAERTSGLPVEQAVVGIGGPTVRGANSRGIIDTGRPREIEQRDVNRAIDRATHVQLQEDRMVVQLFPQDFVVDDHPGHRDPRRMIASRLEANVHLITGSVLEHTCLVSAVNQAHLVVEETVFEPLAACFAAVLPEDRVEGIAVVDIGAHSTDLVVYHGDALQLASTLPICGDHFTRDLAAGLRIGFEDAALVKEEYGCAISSSTAENSIVEVPSHGREPREVQRRYLNAILEARAQELFLHVRRELARVGMDRCLMSGLVLTGGGAKLPGMCDMAEGVLPCHARNGLATGIMDWPEDLDNPAWTVAAGLAMYSGRLKLQGELERQSVGLLGRILG